MRLTKPLTRSGYGSLAAEHDWLYRTERPRVVAGIATAAAEGDRSENAEYIYGKKRLRELDKRLKYLAGLLKDAQVIDPKGQQGDSVCFGCTVSIELEGGKKQIWTIVGEGEADASVGSISWRAPMAAALLGKQVGDVVEVRRPAGEIEVEILGLVVGEQKFGLT